jgi:hypothetical protein
MNWRSHDKPIIKAFLESITFEGSNLTVYTERTISAVTPFCVVSSGSLNPSEGGSHMLDTGHYFRGFGYRVMLIWNARPSEELTQINEESIDQLEADILDLFETDDFKYCNSVLATEKWQDCVPGTVSSPFSGVKVGLEENYLVKEFPITIKRETPRN